MAPASVRRRGLGWLVLVGVLLGPAHWAGGDIIVFSAMEALGGGPDILRVRHGDAIMLGNLLIGPAGQYDEVHVEGGLLSVSGVLTLTDPGWLEITGGTVRAFAVDVQGGALDLLGGVFQTVSFGGDLLVDGGTLQTWSSLGINTYIQGDLTVDDGSIRLALVNTYPQGFPQWRWNKLIVQGDLVVDGTLDVSMVLITPSMMVEGLVFDVLDWGGTIEGHFDQVNLPDLPPGLGWNTDDLYTTGELRVIPEPAALVLLTAGGTLLLTRQTAKRRS